MLNQFLNRAIPQKLIISYRPISLTCVLSKVMESIIREQMLEYLLKNNLIYKHQHGFISGRSTCTQLLETLEDWSIELQMGESVDVVYIDFLKAFDSVVHSKLLAKLEGHGICYELLGWIANSGVAWALPKVGPHYQIISRVSAKKFFSPFLWIFGT